MLRKSSIWCKLFESSKFGQNFENFENSRKNEKYSRGAPALRVIRARTRLTVHRSLPVNVEPAVNRQPGFRRKLVEQKPTMLIRQLRTSFIQMHLINNFHMKLNFLNISENHQFFQHFSKQMLP